MPTKSELKTGWGDWFLPALGKHQRARRKAGQTLEKFFAPVQNWHFQSCWVNFFHKIQPNLKNKMQHPWQIPFFPVFKWVFSSHSTSLHWVKAIIANAAFGSVILDKLWQLSRSQVYVKLSGTLCNCPWSSNAWCLIWPIPLRIVPSKVNGKSPSDLSDEGSHP